MTYIGVPQPARALTSDDINEGAVTLADIAFTDTPSNLNLNGIYNNQTMRLAHNITTTGDVTLDNSKAFTVSSSSGLLVSSAGHNLSDNDQIQVQTSATLPTGLSANTYYFVISKTTDTFKLSTSIGGSAIAYTNTGSGTHTWYKDVNLVLAKISDDGNPVTLTNDGSTRTITGIGSLEASTLAQTPNASLTGMTGEISSSVLSKATFEGTLNSSTTFSGDAGKRTAKVWVRSNNSADMLSTFGVSSLADTGTGVITVTFLTAFPNNNYVGLVMTQDKSGNFMHFCRMAQQTTTTCTIENYQNNAAADGGSYHFAIFGE